MTAFLDSSSNFHPYECDGPGKCPHCDRRFIVCNADEGTQFYAHDPAVCELCDPEYDMQPNPHRALAAREKEATDA